MMPVDEYMKSRGFQGNKYDAFFRYREHTPMDQIKRHTFDVRANEDQMLRGLEGAYCRDEIKHYAWIKWLAHRMRRMTRAEWDAYYKKHAKKFGYEYSDLWNMYLILSDVGEEAEEKEERAKKRRKKKREWREAQTPIFLNKDKKEEPEVIEVKQYERWGFVDILKYVDEEGTD